MFGLLLDYWNIAFGKTLPQAQTCKDLEGGATRQFVSSDPDERAIAFLTTAFANQYLFSIKKNPGIFASPPARQLHCSDQVANFRDRKDEIKALSRAMGLRCYIHAGKSLEASDYAVSLTSDISIVSPEILVQEYAKYYLDKPGATATLLQDCHILSLDAAADGIRADDELIAPPKMKRFGSSDVASLITSRQMQTRGVKAPQPLASDNKIEYRLSKRRFLERAHWFHRFTCQELATAAAEQPDQFADLTDAITYAICLFLYSPIGQLSSTDPYAERVALLLEKWGFNFELISADRLEIDSPDIHKDITDSTRRLTTTMYAQAEKSVDLPSIAESVDNQIARRGFYPLIRCYIEAVGELWRELHAIGLAHSWGGANDANIELNGRMKIDAALDRFWPDLEQRIRDSEGADYLSFQPD